MGNALYAQVLGVLLLFAFLFFIFLAAKGWRWHHVTALVLIFFSSLMFVFLAASVLKTHTVWQKRHQQLATELEQELQKTSDLRFGPLGPGNEQADSVRRLRNELERVINDRGRVWRDVQKANADQQSGQVTLRFPDRNVTGVDTPPPLHRLQPSTIVFAFKEVDSPDGWKAPARFLGEFVVQDVQPDSVVVTPSLPLDPYQVNEVMTNDGLTWALYEVMPNDAYFKWASLADDPAVRENMIRELLMPGGWHGRPAMAPPEMYEEVVSQFIRDGQEPAPDDPPERTWVVIELTQPWKVDVDAPEAATQEQTRQFDVAGLALLPQLRQGAASEFEPGDQIELDAEAAERLISQGIAKRIKTIYRRPLRDYTYSFDESNRRIRGLNERVRLVTKANNTLQGAIDKAKKQIAYRTDEKAKLGEDLQHINQERDAMKQHLAALQTSYKDLLGNLRALFTENLELVDRLRRIEQAVVDAIQQQLANTGP